MACHHFQSSTQQWLTAVGSGHDLILQQPQKLTITKQKINKEKKKTHIPLQVTDDTCIAIYPQVDDVMMM